MEWISDRKGKERQTFMHEDPKKEKDRNYPEDKNNKGDNEDKKDREV